MGSRQHRLAFRLHSFLSGAACGGRRVISLANHIVLLCQCTAVNNFLQTVPGAKLYQRGKVEYPPRDHQGRVEDNSHSWNVVKLMNCVYVLFVCVTMISFTLRILPFSIHFPLPLPRAIGKSEQDIA